MYKSHNTPRQQFTQTPLPILRNFKCWQHEVSLLLLKSGKSIEVCEETQAMYYNGGYSPKMFINEVLMIPVDVNIFS